MQRAAICFAGVMWLIAAQCPTAFAADQTAGAVYTNKVRFRIPFRYDPAEMQRLQAREVQLYVSTDHGLRWRMADKAEPRSDHFDFLAPADAEYWFAVRTLDAFNRVHPAGNAIEPALKVIVDATPPVLELLLTELEPGRVELRWTAADDHLDVSKLRIEYRQPDSPEWQPAAVVPQPSGQIAWEVRTGGVVAVRGSINDLAGNSITAERELNIHPSSKDHKKGETEYRAPVAKATEPTVADTAHNTPPAAPGGANPPETATAENGSNPPSSTVKPQVPTAPSGAEPSEHGLTSDHEFFANEGSNPSSNPGGKPGGNPGSNPGSNPGGNPGGNPAGNPGSGSLSSTGPTIQPKVRNELVSDSPATRPSIVQKPQVADTAPIAGGPGDADDTKSSFVPSPASTPTAPKDEEPRTIVVNSCDFQVGYRVDDLGPSGLGRKWYRYGTDPDNKSPFAVNVPSDGTYGFELRVTNGAGIGDDPPRPGDKPSIVVMVDKTAPVAQLLAPQIGRGKSRNKVLLRWVAEDAHFGPTPILLEYAAQGAGPWQKIGDWQANSGRYIWSIEPGLPGKVYVRLTVKDRAGNVTQITAPDQLVIDFTRPTARIVDVEASSATQSHD